MSASCADCKEHPAQRTVWGCEGRQEPWIDPLTDDEYYACPIKFISDQAFEWYAEYAYINKYPSTALPYRSISFRYLEACREYEQCFKDFNTIANGGTVRG